MSRPLTFGLLAAALVAVAATPAHAQWVFRPRLDPYTRPHFYLAASGAYVHVLDATGPRSFLDDGGGFDLTAGFRFSRFFALEGNWESTFHNVETDAFGNAVDRVGLHAFTGDLKLYPGARGPVQPYFTVGAGAYAMGDSLGSMADGPGYQIGGGVDFWLSPWAALGVKVQYRGVELVDYDPQNDSTYLSLVTGALEVSGRF